MAKKILADTGFWIALFYEDDKYRTKVLSIELRSMLLDKSLHIDGFISFNPGDFHDVCTARKIEMLYPS